MTKIFPDDVIRLAEQLACQGEYPSCTRILALHKEQSGKGGSIGTVARHLQTWRELSAAKEINVESLAPSKCAVLSGEACDADWPNVSSSIDTLFIDADDYLARVKAISKEIGAVPSPATLFDRLRYAGHWLTKVQQKDLSLRLHLPIERSAGTRSIWNKQDLIDAVIVACRNNQMRLPTSIRLVELFGNQFRLAALAQFNGHIPIAKEAKKMEPYIVLRPSICCIDGTEVQSNGERLVYDGLFTLLSDSKSRLSVGLTIKGEAYCPDIVIDNWLFVEIMMFDWDTPIPEDDWDRKRLISSYLDRNKKKRALYVERGRNAIFIEPKYIHDPKSLSLTLQEIVALVEQGHSPEFERITVSKNVYASRQCQSLQEIKRLLEPLYSESGFFPTTSVLRKAGLVGAEVAIRKTHGGRDNVASIFGWPTKTRQFMPRGFFNDFENIEKGIMALVPKGTDEMPTQATLMAKFSAGFVAAIHRQHGGMGGVARALGLTVSKGSIAAQNAVPYGTWNDLNSVLEAVRTLVGLDSRRMPYRREFLEAGVIGAYQAIVTKHGGLEKVACELGLVVDAKAAAISKARKKLHASV